MSTSANDAHSTKSGGSSLEHVKSGGASDPRHLVPEYGYPRGHLGYLNEEQEKALRDFKVFIEEKGLYKPGPPPSHDDPTLLRFLRARKWVVQDAYQQFKDTEDWRAANEINVLYDTIDVEAYAQSRLVYPQWTGRRDRRGIPFYVFEIRHLDHKAVTAYEKSSNAAYSKAKSDGKTPARLLPLFALYENLTRFVQPLCTQLTDRDHPRVPITLSTNIVDVSGVSLRQFWMLKTHMQAASQLATSHYPETLDRIFIVGAPMFFTTVWGWIKRWFDPVTVSKIFILSHHEVLPTLESFVDRKNIPKMYGGELEWRWGDMPELDPAVKEAMTFENGYTDLPISPLVWRPTGDGKRLELVALGTIDKKERAERVGTIARPFADEDAKPETKADEASKAAVAAPAAEEVTEKPVEAVDDASKQEQPVVTDGIAKEKVPEVSASAHDEVEVQGVQGIQNLAIAVAADEQKEAKVSEKLPGPDAASSGEQPQQPVAAA